MPEFTSDQKRAIREEGNIIVSAGAGSGKTAVLSERVLYYIREKGYAIEDFLILTFTRLAAGEMKKRIRDKLSRENLPDAHRVDLADITTFDSFSSNLVWKYHSILGLDPDFTIVDQNVIGVLKRKCLREELDRYYEEEDAALIEWIDRYCFKDDEAVLSLLTQIVDLGDLEIDKADFYANFTEKYFSSPVIDAVFHQIEAMIKQKIRVMIDGIERVPDILLSNGESLWNQSAKLLDRIDEAESYDEMLSCIEAFSWPRLPPKSRDLLDEAEWNDFQRIKKEMKDLKDSLKDFACREEETRRILENRKYAEILLRICQKVDAVQTEYKFAHQAFEFGDISRFALKLVRENPSIRDELKNHYRMIMIDEYQDTSEIQEVFISFIQNRNVYCVGDIKQSIYAFRNARCDIFKDKYDRYKGENGGRAIDLKMNFRSRREVLNDINTIFRDLMSDAFGGANYRKDHLIDYGNKMYLKEDAGQNHASEVYTYRSGGTEKEIRIIAEDIVAKINGSYSVMEASTGNLRPCRFQDFAIILDRGTSFDEYIRIFNEYQIPLYVERDEDIKDNAIVRLLANLLILLDAIAEQKAFDATVQRAYASVARSFIYHYDDETIYRLFKEKRFVQDRIYRDFAAVLEENPDLSGYRLVLSLFSEMEIYEKLTRIGDIEKNQAYLDSFLNTFSQMENLGFSVSDFIDYLDHVNEYNLKFTLPSQGSSSDSVRLLNIHKSKGLEFNIVYFPALNRRFPDPESRIQLGVSKAFGLYFNDEDHPSLIRKAHNFTRRMDEISERIRLFYVALTRAREKMIFVLPLVEDYAEKSVFEARSFYDFFYPFLTKFACKDAESLSSVRLKADRKDPESETFVFQHPVFDLTRRDPIRKASKEISFVVDERLLNFGTQFHFLLETVDFLHPDYDKVNPPWIREKIRAFLRSEPMKDLTRCKIYKEYEFVDEKNATEGIIDLFLVFPDKVVLIDYKTKNIDDAEYDAQMNVYADFLKEKYGLPIEAYLYSLLDETYRLVKNA